MIFMAKRGLEIFVGLKGGPENKQTNKQKQTQRIHDDFSFASTPGP